MESNESDIIDPEEVFLGEDNQPIADGDFGGNPNPNTGENLNQESNTGDESSDQSPNPDQGQENKGKDDYANPAEYAMKWLGYDTDEVDFGDGNKVKLNELTPEQQSDVLLNQLENVVDAYEAEIQNLKTGTPQLENDFQKQVWDFLKTNNNPKELAEYILKNDPQGLITSLPEEDLVRRHLSETMNLEGEELESELKFLKDNNRLDTFSARAKKYFEAKGVDLTGLNQEHQQRLQEAEQVEVQAYEAEKTKVLNLASQVKDISGIPVAKEISDFIANQITPASHKEDSAFIQGLNNPEKLYRLAFLDNYFEDIIDNVKQSYFDMGKKSVGSPAESLSREPVKVRSFRVQSESSRPSAVTKDGKVDLNKLLQTDISI